MYCLVLINIAPFQVARVFSELYHIIFVTHFCSRFRRKLVTTAKWFMMGQDSSYVPPSVPFIGQESINAAQLQNATAVDYLQEAQLSLTNCATLFCKVIEVLQDFLSENVDKKFTTDYNVA